MITGRAGMLVVLALPALLGAPVSGAAAAVLNETTPPARKVLIVSMPSVTWEDVQAGDAPNLRRLGRRGSIAAMSIRTVGSRTGLASALLSIGAGNRARADGIRPVLQGDADAAPNAAPEPGGGARVRAMPQVRADNRNLSFGAVPGALGQRLHALGLRTGVAGNSDGGFIYPTSTRRKGTGLERRRFGALALADSSGRVDVAEIGKELITRDGSTLNGYRANSSALVQAASRVIGAADVSLVELADTYRESSIAYATLKEVAVPGGRPPAVRAAIRRDDRVLGELVKLVDLNQDAVIVAGTSGRGPAKPENLTIAVSAGVGAKTGGWLTSATTLRPGLVTISDIGPGILHLFKIDPPASMTGQAFHASAGSGSRRLAGLVRLEQTALFQGAWVGRFFVIFVSLQVVLYSLAWAMLRRREVQELPWVRRLTLGFMAVPAATFVLTATRAERWGPAGPLLIVLAVSAVMAVLALRGPWRRQPTGPAAFICALNVLLLVGDLLSGSRLQLSSLIGYSPVGAGRFYGIGNLAFAVLATSALLLAGQVGAKQGARGIWLAAFIGAVTIVADGASPFGADFGGVLALIPAFGVLLSMLAGRRVTWPRMLAVGGAAVAAATGVGLLDAMRPPEAQTHIGRFVGRLVKDGPGAVQEVVLRKAQANWALLTRSFLTLSVPVALLFLGLLLRRPRGKLRTVVETQRGFRIGLIGAIVANVLGFLLNDSGIAIPAMGLAVLAPYCLATLLGAAPARGSPAPGEEAARQGA